MSEDAEHVRLASVGHRWYKWALNNLPDRQRGIGNRQLYLIYNIISNGDDGYETKTRGDAAIAASLYDRGILRRKRNRYFITDSGKRTFQMLRGEDWYKKRDL